MGGGMGMGGPMTPETDPGAWPPPASPEAELESLKAQASAIEEQLRVANERIADLQGATSTSPLIAVADAEKCVACGRCVDACPVGAISLSDTAEVEINKCTGCGRCVTVCPQGALSLHARS